MMRWTSWILLGLVWTAAATSRAEDWPQWRGPQRDGVWRTEGVVDELPDVEDGYVYAVDSYGELRCLEAATGKRVWEDLTAVPKARWSTIHMVRQADRVWMFNERGELLITRLSPKGLEILDRCQLIEPTNQQLNQRGGVCWSHPAFAEQSVFARNDQRIVRASLAKPGDAAR